MEISCLPNEILEKVFCLLDGISLSKSRLICHRWSEIVAQLERNNRNTWQNCCLSEIQSDVLMELLGNKKVSCVWSNEFWKNIYIKFYRSQNVTKYPSIRQKIQLPDIQPITCIKVSGKRVGLLAYFYSEWGHQCTCKLQQMQCNWRVLSSPILEHFSWDPYFLQDSCSFYYYSPCYSIFKIPAKDIYPVGDCLITGNRSGHVWLWDATLGNVIQPIAKHKKPVTDIILLDLFNLGKYAALECTAAHHHVITSGMDRAIKFAPLLISEKNPIFEVQYILQNENIEYLRVFENCLLAKCGQTIFMWELNIVSPSSVTLQISKIVTVLESFPVECLWIGFWKDEITCISEKIDRYTFSIKENDWISLQAPCVLPSCDVNNYLCVAVDGQHFRIYSTIASLKGAVTSVLVFSNIFILGTDTGAVYFYSFEKNEDLLNLNLEEPLCSKVVASTAIVSMDIWLNTKKIVMAIGVTGAIYVVHWIPKMKRDYKKLVLP